MTARAAETAQSPNGLVTIAARPADARSVLFGVCRVHFSPGQRDLVDDCAPALAEILREGARALTWLAPRPMWPEMLDELDANKMAA